MSDLRISRASLAIISQDEDWLLIRNESWDGFSMVGGKIEEGESSDQAMLREIQEELSLDDQALKLRQLQSPVVFEGMSQSAGVLTRYQWTIFEVDTPISNLDVDGKSLRLCSPMEIEAGFTLGGRAIGEQVRRVFHYWQAERHTCDVVRVNWINGSAIGLNSQLKRQIDNELLKIYSNVCPQHVTVQERLRGYRDAPEEKVILAVEVGGFQRLFTDVIKLGKPDEVVGDYFGHRIATTASQTSSRIFVGPKIQPLGPQRCAVVYPNLYRFFHNDGRNDRPQTLEALVDACIESGNPSLSSICRTISQVATEAKRCLYSVASEVDSKAMATWYERELTPRTKDDQAPGKKLGLLDEWDGEREKKLRLEMSWLAHARKHHDSLEDIRYTDPIDTLRWVFEDVENRVPAGRKGYAHGDLNGRNILVGVLRNQATWPAVIDFEKMGEQTPTVWDFVKLEVELKTQVLTGRVDQKALREDWLRYFGHRCCTQPVVEDADSREPNESSRRLDRMQCFLAFEDQLASWTQYLTHGRCINPSPGFEPRLEEDNEFDRALRIVMRIRQEAALAVSPDRDLARNWRRQYYFALMVYGVSAIRWNLETQSIRRYALLACAGTAAAHWLAESKHELPVFEDLCLQEPKPVPSYLYVSVDAIKKWKRGDRTAIPAIAKWSEAFDHAVLLKNALWLFNLDSEDGSVLDQVDAELKQYWERAVLAGDFELLCRIGRSYKQRATRIMQPPTDEQAWDPTQEHSSMLNQNAKTWLRSALENYRLAYEISGKHYPAINAATVAMMLEDEDQTTRLATSAQRCAEQILADAPEYIWAKATVGEASLLLRQVDRAIENYSIALTKIGDDHRAKQTVLGQTPHLRRRVTPEEWQKFDDAMQQFNAPPSDT